MKIKQRVFILLYTMVLAVSLSACAGLPGAGSSEPSSRRQAVMNQAVDIRPQDDFYESVNSKMLAKADFPPEESSWDISMELEQQISENLRLLAKRLMENQAGYSVNSTESAVIGLYGTALDYEGREKAGTNPLKPYLDALDSSDSVAAYLKAAADIRRELGKSSLITFSPSPDINDSSRYVLIMDQPVLLSEKETLVETDTANSLKEYMADLLAANGMDKNQAMEWGEKLLVFQKDLARTALTAKESINPLNTNNPLTQDILKADIPNLDIDSFLEVSGQEGYSKWVVTNPSMLPLINRYLTQENLELVKQYSIVCLLNDYASYMNREFVQAKASFEDNDYLEEELAWNAVLTLADMDLGELYVKNFVSPGTKQSVEQMTYQILNAYKENLKNLEWMSKESRLEAVKKLDSMNIKVGYPDRYPGWIKGGAVKSPGEGGSLIENAVSVSRRMAEDERSMSSRLVDREAWDMSPQTVNAYYDPSGNEIVLPAAMLQPPFYDENASYASNLGGIGATIGHEITHAFDDSGALFDEKGNLRNWWTKGDYEAFSGKKQELVDYFGQYEGLPGVKVDGELTLGENIADLGGISAIASIVGEDREGLKEMFQQYSLCWVGSYTEDDLKNQLENDEHAPAKVRVNAVLSSTEAFYKAFDVKPGDGMYVAPEKRVHLY